MMRERVQDMRRVRGEYKNQKEQKYGRTKLETSMGEEERRGVRDRGIKIEIMRTFGIERGRN